MRSPNRIQFIGVAAFICTFFLVHQWLYRHKSSLALLAEKAPWKKLEVSPPEVSPPEGSPSKDMPLEGSSPAKVMPLGGSGPAKDNSQAASSSSDNPKGGNSSSDVSKGGNLSSDVSKAAQNSTLGFEKVFYISLPSRTDRQDMMSMLASTTNVTLTYQRGAIGDDIPDKSKPSGGEHLKSGQLGCWRSHADVWKRMLDENIQTAIILEDDADWDVEVHDIFERFSRHMQNTKLGGHTRTEYEKEHAPYGLEWDLIYIGHCWEIPRKEKPHKTETYEDPSAPNQHEMKGEFSAVLREYGVKLDDNTRVRVVAPSWYSVCTVGYAVTLKGARKLLYTVGNGQGLNGPVDLAMIAAIQKGQLTALTIVPPFVTPYAKGSKLDSDIAEPPKEGEPVEEPAGSDSLRNGGRKALEKLAAEKSPYESDLA